MKIERQKDKDRKTERQKDRKTERQKDRKTERQKDKGRQQPENTKKQQTGKTAITTGAPMSAVAAEAVDNAGTTVRGPASQPTDGDVSPDAESSRAHGGKEDEVVAATHVDKAIREAAKHYTHIVPLADAIRFAERVQVAHSKLNEEFKAGQHKELLLGLR
eukprot:SAG31_NODE_692_length_12772_cov_15.543044_8_plen_161_part_00